MKELSLTTCSVPGIIVLLNPNYSLMITEFAGDYEVYARKHKDGEGSTPWLYMFGFPVPQQPIEEVIEMAIANLDDYEFLFAD